MRFYYLTLLVILLILLPAQLLAKQPLQVDSTSVNLREPLRQSLAKYNNDDAFNYGTIAKEEQSLLEQIKAWIREQLSNLFGNTTFQQVFEIFIYLLFAALIIVLINQLLTGNITGLFQHKNGIKPSGFDMNSGDSDQDNWQKLIDEAIDNNQLSKAVRYLYKQRLHQLEQAGYITWKQNKTNHDYLYEINDTGIGNLFREVTRYYEFTEYGGFAINRKEFDHIKERFKEMTNQIQTS